MEVLPLIAAERWRTFFLIDDQATLRFLKLQGMSPHLADMTLTRFSGLSATTKHIAGREQAVDLVV